MAETGDPLVDIATFINAASEACASTAAASIQSTRTTMESTVKVNVMGLGRVRDLFDAMAAQTAERIRECGAGNLAEATRQLSTQASRHADELARLRSESAEALATQAGSHEASLSSQVAELRTRLQQERDELVSEAQEREASVRGELKALVERTSDSESLIRKGEQALAVAHDEVEKSKEKVTQLQDKTRRSKEQWKKDLDEVLVECTLAADFTVDKVDEARPWRKKKVGTLEALLSQVESIETPSGQLKALMAAYEEARKNVQEQQEEDRIEMEKLLAREVARRDAQQLKMADERQAWQAERDELKAALGASEASMRSLQEEMAQLQVEMKAVESHAKEQAGVEARRLEEELKTKQTQIASQSQAAEHSFKEHRGEIARLKASLKEAHAQLAAQGSKLAATAAALSATRAAGMNHGYYCSAAPSSHYSMVHSMVGTAAGNGSPGAGMGSSRPIREHIETMFAQPSTPARGQQPRMTGGSGGGFSPSYRSPPFGVNSWSRAPMNVRPRTEGGTSGSSKQLQPRRERSKSAGSRRSSVLEASEQPIHI